MWSASRPGRFTPGERAPDTHWIGSWVGPRAGQDAVEKGKISRRELLLVSSEIIELQRLQLPFNNK
jgi:hypothetical protein